MFRTLVLLCLCAVCSAVTKGIGLPAGLLAECPGMNRSTTLSEKTKQSLSLVAIYPSKGLFDPGEKTCSLDADGVACVASTLDLNNKTIQVLISGYLDSSISFLVRSVVTQYLALDRHVIVLEIFPILLRSYTIAARVTNPLGKQLGEFLAELTQHGLTADRLELVGASLGAHTASYAALKFRELTGQRPARLTGLDPAGPCFRNLPADQRMSAGVAERVDALHTNIDGFGIAEPVAQVDFYANGGEYQPSVAGKFVLPCFLLCSHIRSAFYWLEAYINTEGFVGVRCDSVAEARVGDCYKGDVRTNLLGPNTNFSSPGIYYLPTNMDSPYARGSSGTRSRSYGVHHYLLKVAPDKDLVI